MIYFIQAKDEKGPIKIGYVRPDRSVRKHFEYLKDQAYDELYLIGANRHGGEAALAELCNSFRYHHIRNGWYKANHRLLALAELARKNTNMSIEQLLAISNNPELNDAKPGTRRAKRLAKKA